MKKLIAIAAVAAMVVAFPASAFWSLDDNNSYSGGHYDGRGDFTGNGDAEGEAHFSMNFTGRARSYGDFRGTGDTDGNWFGHGYDYPYWYGNPYGAYTPWMQQRYQAPAPAAQQ